MKFKCLYQARKVYMCVRSVDFASFCDYSIGIWNCSDSVVLFCFSCYLYRTSIINMTTSVLRSINTLSWKFKTSTR